MNIKIEPTWKKALEQEWTKPYFKELTQLVREEYQNHTIFPPAKEIFAAFNATAFDSVKVVILGQDPYHGAAQANGLCFSVNQGVALPPSLKNMFKELTEDLGVPTPNTGDLSPWAKQGVLLLNSILTVREGQAGSHQNHGWERFTTAAIEQLATQKSGIVFLLWGAYAQKKAAFINPNQHFVLKSAHPSPLSAYRGFFGCKHFSKTNQYLKNKGVQPIDWAI